jgi:HSP20 family protein
VTYTYGGAKNTMTFQLQRFDPFRELLNLQQRMNRVFDEAVLTPRVETETATAQWSPAVDIYETDGEIVVKAELPDIRQEDIQVSVDNDRLSIRGERKFESEVKRENFHRIERSYGSFSRVFTLPPTVDQERIKADYRNGILSVTLPKRELAQSKQINVQVG